jgi:hypothetical protein
VWSHWRRSLCWRLLQIKPFLPSKMVAITISRTMRLTQFKEIVVEQYPKGQEALDGTSWRSSQRWKPAR